MKKTVSRVIAVFLSVIMTFSLPVISMASVSKVMSLSVNKPELYAGITYEITATVNNLTEAELIGGTGDAQPTAAFTWSGDISGVMPISTNNYSVVKDENGTYTVSEVARFTMPPAGTTVHLTAAYGNVISKTIEHLSHTPTTSFSLNCERTDHVYYHKDADTLYIDQTVSKAAPINADFTVFGESISNEDPVVLAATSDKFDITDLGSGKFRMYVYHEATEYNKIIFAPQSGYPFTKVIDVVKCVPLISYTMTVKGYADKSALKISESAAISGGITTDNCGKTTSIAGDSILFAPTDKKTAKGTSNDVFSYELYTDSSLTRKAPDTYYSVDKKYNCTVTIPNPGTYYMITKNVSPGNGCLKRDLYTVTSIVVTQANPITDIKFYKTDEQDNLTKEPLTDLTLYTNSHSTYDISKNVSILPVGYTHGISYYSSNTSVATVDEATGVITALTNGYAQIYAKSDDNSAMIDKCDVNVVVGIKDITSITAQRNSLPAGHSQQLSATVSPSNAQEKIYWSSSNSDILTVSSSGYATANPDYDFEGAEEKLVEVTAKSEFGKSKSIYITVVPAKRASVVDVDVTSTDSSPTFRKDGKACSDFAGKSFHVTVNAADGFGNDTNDLLVWKVSVADKAFIDFNEATAYLSYTYNENNNSYNVISKTTLPITIYCFAQRTGESFDPTNVFGQFTISTRAKVTSLSMIDPDTSKSKSSVTLSVGSSTSVLAKVNIDAYNTDPVSFESSDTSVASIDVNDHTVTITAHRYGTATINVRCESNNKTAAIKVTVCNNIGAAECYGVNSYYEYTGSAIAPEPALYFNGLPLAKGIDYKVTYSNNVNAGYATMTITGIKDFNASSKIINYTILPKQISSCTASAIGLQKLTTSTRIVTPKATVKDTVRNKTLADGTGKTTGDYSLAYANNTFAGVGTAVVTGKGNYTGVIYINFSIEDTATPSSIKGLKKYDNSSSAIYLSWTTVKGVTGYQICDQYGNVRATLNGAGTAKCKISKLSAAKYYYFTVRAYTIANGNIFYGPLSGSVKASTKSKTPKSKLTTKSKSITAKWSKVSGISGYQIQCSTSSKFKKAKTYTLKSKTKSKKFTKLKKGKKYYVRLRTYKTVNGKKIYSSWYTKSIKCK